MNTIWRRIVLPAVLACGLATATATAGPRDVVMSAVARCSALRDDQAWLDCYLAAARSMQTLLDARAAAANASAQPSAPATAAATAAGGVAESVTAAMPAGVAAPAAATDAGSGFGLAANADGNQLTAPAAQVSGGTATVKAAADSDAVDHITAHLVSYRFSSQNYFTVVLDNGQTWRQINGDNAFAELKLPAQQYAVTIKHGFFGSYNLTIAGQPGLFRVRRIA